MKTLTLLLLLTTFVCNCFGHKAFQEKFIFTEENNNVTVTKVEDEDELKYPKNDEKRHKVITMWNDYYRCLEEKENEELNKPEIQRLVEGQFTEFFCPICPKPFQDYNELKWKYRVLNPKYNMTELEHLDLTTEMELTKTKTLKIYNAIEEISGLYACYHGKNLISAYILEVSKNDIIEEVEWNSENNFYTVKYCKTIFFIYYKWSSWTECSLCDNIGRKYKYGSCYVTNEGKNFGYGTKKVTKKLHEQQSELFDNYENTECVKERTNQTGNFLGFFLRNFNFFGNENKNHSADVPVVNEENVEYLVELAQKFKNGVPCFSSYVTNLGLKLIQQRPAVKVIMKHCRATCSESKLFAIFDKNGKIIDWANNTAGIYSAYQKIPKPPVDIDRRSVTADFNSDITILCPRTLLKNIPITWKINEKLIFPNIIANESNGRITIDLINRIHINKLKLKDSHIYSCWQREHLVGTVRINVVKRFKISFNHHVTLFGLTTVIGILLLIAFKILAKELKTRNK